MPSVMIVLVAVMLAATFYYSEMVFLLLAGAYLLHGPVFQFVRFMRHRHARGSVSGAA
jgi:hypothetical protein